jgi:hypothetical protein
VIIKVEAVCTLLARKEVEAVCTLLARKEVAAVLLGTSVAASNRNLLAVFLAGNIAEGVD